MPNPIEPGISTYSLPAPVLPRVETRLVYISELVSQYYAGILIADSEVRGNVDEWSEAQKADYIRRLIAERCLDIQPFVVLRNEKGDLVLVDGVQRLEAVLQYQQNSFPIEIPNSAGKYYFHDSPLAGLNLPLPLQFSLSLAHGLVTENRTAVCPLSVLRHHRLMCLP
jgi:hypothetical protein